MRGIVGPQTANPRSRTTTVRYRPVPFPFGPPLLVGFPAVGWLPPLTMCEPPVPLPLFFPPFMVSISFAWLIFPESLILLGLPDAWSLVGLGLDLFLDLDHLLRDPKHE